MIYENNHQQELSAWDAFYSSFMEKAEECYVQWLNGCELSEAEIKLAKEYQVLINDNEDMIEIEIPPEYEVSPEELSVMLRIADKLQKQGLGQLISMMAGADLSGYFNDRDTLTDDTCKTEKASRKCSVIKVSDVESFNIDTRVF